jgi:hypothetical protein
MANFPEEGQLITDPDGVAYMAYPTGRVVPIEPKKINRPEKSETKSEEESGELPSFEEANK